jgi:transcriptional regulator with XRE-family HTH domain
MKPGTTINQRLAMVRNALGHSQQAFATLLGISRSYLANIERDRKEIPVSILTFLIETFAVKPNYLLTGQGTMFVKKGEVLPAAATREASLFDIEGHALPGTTIQKGTDLRILVTTVDASGHDNISLVSTRAAAGYAAGGFTEPEFLRDLPAFSLPDRAFKNGTFRAFQVSGESMQPTLCEGDWVICRYVEQWDRDIRDTFVHVVVTAERPVVKRLLNRLADRGQLSLLSDNPAFATQFVDGADVREVWVAVGRLSRQFANPRYDLVQEVTRTRSDVDELMVQFQALQTHMGLKLV